MMTSLDASLLEAVASGSYHDPHGVLGAHLDGAEELETYAMIVDGADEAGAAMARREARLARAQLN